MMKFLSAFIISILLFSTLASAQKKFEPLAENATLEETQAWLKKALKKFSPNDVYSLKFKGCNLKVDGSGVYFSSFNSTADNSTPAFVEGDFASMSRSSLSSGGSYVVPVFWRYTFDLKDIDVDNILLRAAGTTKAQVIQLHTIGRKKSIASRGNRRYFNNSSQNFVSFTVKQEYAEQIKTAFARAIKLCSE